MCENKTCPVHERVNVREDVTDEFGSGRAFTYEGDYAVVTLDNPAHTDPMVMLDALLGGGDFTPPGMFMTLVVKVGDKAVGDLSPVELEKATVHREEFIFPGDETLTKFMDATPDENGVVEGFAEALTEIFHDKHDEAVLAVQGGVIS